MSLKNLTLMLLALGLFAAVGCNKDDDHDHDGDNKITIRFLEPMGDQVVADASDVHIHLEVEASDENHNVEILLHPDGDLADKILDVDLHDHDKVISFEQDLDLSSYPSGTVFHLEVEACIDHDCEEKEFADIEFSIP